MAASEELDADSDDTSSTHALPSMWPGYDVPASRMLDRTEDWIVLLGEFTVRARQSCSRDMLLDDIDAVGHRILLFQGCVESQPEPGTVDVDSLYNQLEAEFTGLQAEIEHTTRPLKRSRGHGVDDDEY